MTENVGLPGRFGYEAEALCAESNAERRSRHRQALEEYEAFVADALEHHARTGEWPPDPLLDEVAEMRRQILAEHDNDYNKVLDWYVELGKQRASGNGHPENPAPEERSAGVSRP
jgi:hypothetical protein